MKTLSVEQILELAEAAVAACDDALAADVYSALEVSELSYEEAIERLQAEP